MSYLRSRSIAVVAALGVFAAACGGGTAQPSPTVAPTGAPTAQPTPKFELSTYMYSIQQVKKKLRVGTREDNIPFARKDPTTNKFEGFDADVAREIVKALFGKPAEADPDQFIEWVPVVSATRIPTLQENKADIIVSTFTINEDRKKQIDFSDVYFSTGQKILVKKDNTQIKGLSDLSGKTVCTATGSTSEKNITAANVGARLLLLDSYPPCLLSLQNGQADAISTDETILFGLVKQDPNTKIVGAYFSDEPYGIGVAKSSGSTTRTGFVPFINGVLKAMFDDGRWAALYKKHITPVSGDVKKSPTDKGTPAT